jgi:hypothetical protein
MVHAIDPSVTVIAKECLYQLKIERFKQSPTRKNLTSEERNITSNLTGNLLRSRLVCSSPLFLGQDYTLKRPISRQNSLFKSLESSSNIQACHDRVIVTASRAMFPAAASFTEI